jgi:16S rRNA (uracil1498-N3)-methyltransferase
MSSRNFYISTIPAIGQAIQLDEAEAYHAVKVLRVQPGATLGLLDGLGTRAEMRVTQVDGQRRRTEVAGEVVQRETLAAPAPALHLFIAPPRAKQMTQIIRTAVELGVRRLVPVICEHSVARPEHDEIPDHWQAEVISAMKQSGNPFATELAKPLMFPDAVRAASMPGCFGAVPTPGATCVAALEAMRQVPALALWIGPEGGFADAETAALREQGLVPLCVGRWVMRVETAVPALLAILVRETVDVRGEGS